MGESSRLEELKRRVEADPASIAFASLAEEYRRAARFEEAVEASRAGLRFHPTYVSARVTLGRSLMELGLFDQAERELHVVARSTPDNLAARRALGDLYWRQGELGRALEQLRTAAGLAPGDGELAELVRELEVEVAAVEPPPVEPETATTATAGRTITRYEWNFGDNVPVEGARVEHVFNRAGGYTVTLTVTDSNGATDTETKTVTVLP